MTCIFTPKYQFITERSFEKKQQFTFTNPVLSTVEIIFQSCRTSLMVINTKFFTPTIIVPSLLLACFSHSGDTQSGLWTWLNNTHSSCFCMAPGNYKNLEWTARNESKKYDITLNGRHCWLASVKAFLNPYIVHSIVTLKLFLIPMQW